jgi:hypothetical protein
MHAPYSKNVIEVTLVNFGGAISKGQGRPGGRDGRTFTGTDMD